METLVEGLKSSIAFGGWIRISESSSPEVLLSDVFSRRSYEPAPPNSLPATAPTGASSKPGMEAVSLLSTNEAQLSSPPLSGCASSTAPGIGSPGRIPA